MTGEFELIDSIKAGIDLPEGFVGIGDDCAHLPETEGFKTLVSTDMLLEDVHFLRRVSPELTGWKAAVANMSDIAACGGTPKGIFLSLAVPYDLEDSWFSSFIDGFKAACRKYSFPLLGGDTCRSSAGICVCVTVLGTCALGKAVSRGGARPGDEICVTGCLGDSAAGLDILLNSADKVDYDNYLIIRHLKPIPRISEGILLAGSTDVNAMMDISDGIGSDLRHILKESHCGGVVEVDRIPVSDALKKFCKGNPDSILNYAISGGEDYELLFVKSAGARIAVPHTVIGRITDGNSLIWQGTSRNFNGYNHFSDAGI